MAITGPTVVSPGGAYEWHSLVTGAVSGTWSGTVLDGEKGAGFTSKWSFPSGVFAWKNRVHLLCTDYFGHVSGVAGGVVLFTSEDGLSFPFETARLAVDLSDEGQAIAGAVGGVG